VMSIVARCRTGTNELANSPLPSLGQLLMAEVGLARRALWTMRRRIRLLVVRIRHPRARFGPGCDIRAGLWLLILSGGNLQIGPKCVVDRSATIECRGTLVIGSRTVFGHHATIGVRDSVRIGSNCLIAEMVSIRDHDHGFYDMSLPMVQQEALTAPVVIEDDVWIGSKATIVRGVRIGRGAIVGANAVVTHDVPPGAIVGGIPARVIREQRAQR
jgi:acetyltransferase-like isoleucine patch superfamily enzyme